jgi:hypothetical protein
MSRDLLALAKRTSYRSDFRNKRPASWALDYEEQWSLVGPGDPKVTAARLAARSYSSAGITVLPSAAILVCGASSETVPLKTPVGVSPLASTAFALPSSPAATV